MRIERTIQVCVAMMAAVATMLLAMSQQSSSLATLAVFVAGLSLLFTDVYGWFAINRHLASAAAMVAVIYAFVSSRGTGLEGQFLSVANLLIHLQIILLFQKKTERIYWQLIVLTLLQVVVAAALNLFFLFGLLLLIYLLAAVAALLLFFVHRETRPFLIASEVSGDGGWTEGGRERSAGEAGRAGQARRNLPAVAGGPRHDVIQIEGMADRKRRVFAGCSAVDPQRQLVRGGVLRSLGWIAVTTVIVTFLVFTLMPRVGNSSWTGVSAQIETGFTTQVALDEMTPILESPELVMRVSFYDEWNRRAYPVRGEPYFRGVTLTYYSSERWSRPSSTQRWNARLQPPEVLVGVVRQDYALEKIPRDILQHVAPAYELRDGDATNIRMDRQALELVRRRRRDNDPDYDPKRYSLGTTGFRDGILSPLVPAAEPPNRIEELFDPRGLEGLTALAAQIVANIPPAETWRRIQTLESHFFQPGLYRYSLEPHPDRNRQIDAVEDFVTNTRSGHCEYFASALTLMLRSQGIPARMVVGYKGGTYNAIGNYYSVRQMDAHAWVEAYLPADQLPESEILPHEEIVNGAWIRLDPTPAGGSDEQALLSSIWKEKWNDAVDYAQLLWNEYVLGLNAKTQKQAIYAPLRRIWTAFTDSVLSRQVWSARWEALQERLRVDTDLIRRGKWFSRQTSTDAAIVAALLTAVYLLGRFCRRAIHALRRRWRNRLAAVARADFALYRELERLLARRGLRRLKHQTPQEFVTSALARCERLAAGGQAQEVLPAIVRAYYRARFGRQDLDSQEQERLERALAELQQVLVNGKTS